MFEQAEFCNISRQGALGQVPITGLLDCITSASLRWQIVVGIWSLSLSWTLGKHGYVGTNYKQTLWGFLWFQWWCDVNTFFQIQTSMNDPCTKQASLYRQFFSRLPNSSGCNLANAIALELLSSENLRRSMLFTPLHSWGQNFIFLAATCWICRLGEKKNCKEMTNDRMKGDFPRNDMRPDSTYALCLSEPKSNSYFQIVLLHFDCWWFQVFQW